MSVSRRRWPGRTTAPLPIGAAAIGPASASGARIDGWTTSGPEEDTMGKTGRKRRARKKKSANHGKRPNA
jgi:hypothetical protein